MVTLTLQQMIDEVRTAAKLPGNNELQSHIVIQLNQRLRHYTAMNQYSDLLVLQENLPIGAAAQAIYTLPANLQHLKEVYYNNYSLQLTSNQPDSFVKRINSTTSSDPRRVTRAGAQIYISPANAILQTDILLVDYYSYPALVIDLTANFPVTILNDVIVLSVAARICKFSDTKLYEMLKIAEKEAYREVRNQSS